ncbi:hypothetical protein IFM89_025221 [Coptis chinensis]|uniref:Pentatricopeptide repeat-containing protein n=1 Tax=Coptis chinensis TaxID=261450 RepID=A0A835LJE2_9MAGN|nr:hypothetical protein IFM89_025221 [Coptis chinensis]
MIDGTVRCIIGSSFKDFKHRKKFPPVPHGAYKENGHRHPLHMEQHLKGMSGLDIWSRYRLLIDARGQANDIEGMEKCVETMKEDGFEPDIQTQGLLVRHYVTGGFTKKAEAILKEMEGANLKQNCWACRILLPSLYAPR